MLITNVCLDNRTGTETYVYDLARELVRLGHVPFVYSPRLGEIAFELRRKGIIVVDDLDQVREAPDIIHGHHYIETLQALLFFPEAPALFVCHDPTAWHSEPPVTERISRYIAVSDPTLGRLIEHSIPKEKTAMFFNAVDLSRFKECSRSLPAKPRRALIFASYADDYNFIRPIQKTCAALGITVDMAVLGLGRAVPEPENVLGQYDVVFAKARCAWEAMACGASVIPCGVEGCSPMVTLKNVEEFQRFNFAVKPIVTPVTSSFLKEQLLSYDPAETGKVTRWVRQNVSLEGLAVKYVALYHTIIEERRKILASQPDYLQKAQKDLLRRICGDLEARIVETKRVGALAERICQLLQEIGRKLRTRFKNLLERFS